MGSMILEIFVNFCHNSKSILYSEKISRKLKIANSQNAFKLNFVNFLHRNFFVFLKKFLHSQNFATLPIRIFIHFMKNYGTPLLALKFAPFLPRLNSSHLKKSRFKCDSCFFILAYIFMLIFWRSSLIEFFHFYQSKE